jgi:hypothetical protein
LLRFYQKKSISVPDAEAIHVDTLLVGQSGTFRTTSQTTVFFFASHWMSPCQQRF